MKTSHYTIPLLFAILLTACDGGKAEKKAEVQPHEEVVEGTGHMEQLKRDPRAIGGAKPQDQVAIEIAQEKLDNSKQNKIIGYWVGDFGKNKINIALFDVRQDSVFGYSICAGNFRPVKGRIMNEEGSLVALKLEEPGTDPYDGEFMMDLDTEEKTGNGTWQPFKKEGNSAKEYELQKREYTYDPSVGQYPQASQRILEVSDVENLNARELEVMRNEIYARHGYSFKNKDMRYLFNRKDWYIPMGIDIRDQLTDLEARNIDLIYQYESYFEEYYDEYGR